MSNMNKSTINSLTTGPLFISFIQVGSFGILLPAFLHIEDLKIIGIGSVGLLNF